LQVVGAPLLIFVTIYALVEGGAIFLHGPDGIVGHIAAVGIAGFGNAHILCVDLAFLQCGIEELRSGALPGHKDSVYAL